MEQDSQTLDETNEKWISEETKANVVNHFSSRTVDPGVHFRFYYRSFRSEFIKERFRELYARFRSYIQEQLVVFRDKGVIDVKDEKQAASVIITLMEGVEFHAQFLTEEGVFESFAASVKKSAIAFLEGGTI